MRARDIIIEEPTTDDVSFRVSSGSDFESGFTVEILVNNQPQGNFKFYIDDDGAKHNVTVNQTARGQGLGKLLLLKTIEVANSVGPGFQSDTFGITPEQQQVYNSLEREGLIQGGTMGVWELTNRGHEKIENYSSNV